jgi:hypothetical protein
MLRAMAVLTIVGLNAIAQDIAPAAALKAGDPVPANFRAFVAADARFEKGSPRNRQNKLHDLVADNALNPTIAVFSRTAPAADTPAAKVTAVLTKLVTDFKAERLGAFVNFITLDKEYQNEEGRDAKAAAAAALSTQLNSGNVPFTLAEKKSAATAAWGLDDKTDLLIVYYDRMTVKKVWSFTADKTPTTDDLKSLTTTIEADFKKK